MPIEVAPGAKEARMAIAAGEVELRVDRGDVRWLFARGKEPKRAAVADEKAAMAMGFVLGGLLAAGGDQRLRFAREPLGEWIDLGSVPEGMRVEALAVWRDGVTAEIDGNVTTLPALARVARGEAAPAEGVLAERAPLAWMEGRRPVEARIGADGRGIAIFSPQAIGATADGGRTFTRIDDRGLFVSGLVADGDRVVLAPGGVNDVFARAYTPGSSALARTPVPEVTPSLVRAKGLEAIEPVDRDAARKDAIEHGTRVRGGIFAPLDRGRAVLDGDDYIELVDGALGIGALGAGVAWSKVPAFDKMCSRDRADNLSASGGTVAFRCGSGFFALRPNQVIHVPLDTGVGAATLESPSSLVVLRVETNAAERTVDTVAYRVDLAQPKHREVIARGPGLWSPDRLYKRAGDASAPQWATRSGEDRHVYRLDPSAGTLTRVEIPPEAPPDLAFAGFSAEGGLVLRSRKTLANLVHVSVGGEVEVRATPLGENATDDPLVRNKNADKTTWGTIAINHDGRGLAIDGGDHAWQTNDAGRTWQPTTPPGPRAQRSRVVCGRTRCELEDVAVRVGWDEAPVSIAEAAPAPRKHGPLSAARAVTLSCAEDAARRPKLDPARHGAPAEITFGADNHLWSGVSIADRTRMPKDPDADEQLARRGVEQEMFVLHGDDDGRVDARSLTRWRIDWRAAEGKGSNVRLHPGKVLAVAWADPTLAVGAFSAILSVRLATDAGSGGPKRARGEFGSAPFPFYDGKDGYFGLGYGSFATPEGVGVLDDHARKLHWIKASGAMETRDWPGLAPMRSRWQRYAGGDGEGALARAADGRWIAAQLGEERSIRLVEIAPDGLSHDTTLLFDPRDRERGVSLLADGDAVFAALVEPVEGGGAELRLRPIDADLRLGAPVTLARGEPGAPLAIPSCGAGAPAAELRLAWPEKVTLKLGDFVRQGMLVREVRFDRMRACVFRTRLDEDVYATAVLRGRGDGAGVARDREGKLAGVTCRFEVAATASSFWR
jgi:hypothetical protein